ncbi:MAG TPA: dihydrofolate reductase family protein, partial [Nakamurella sp.]
SLDGYIAPDGMTMEHADDPDHHDWMRLWSQLQSWVFPQTAFRERFKLGEGGQTGTDNDLVERTFARTGARIMGRRMFDGGERFWPEEAPFHHPVFVLTHQAREPWMRLGTIFTFVNSGGESGMYKALARATAAAAGKDVRIAGGGDVVRQFLNAGLVDEFTLSIAPIFLGGGVRLFDGIDRTKVGLDVAGVIASGSVTHATYRCTPVSDTARLSPAAVGGSADR